MNAAGKWQRPGSPWPRRDEELLALWMQTDPVLTTMEIGARMGMTKHAVIGRAHRLKLPSRQNPIIRGAVAGAPKLRWNTAALAELAACEGAAAEARRWRLGMGSEPLPAGALPLPRSCSEGM